MKNSLLLTAFILLITTLQAQDAKPGHENHYKAPAKVETDAYTLEFADAMAEMEFSKLKVTITNKTEKFLLFETESVQFNIGGKNWSPEAKMIIIPPKEKKSKVLEVKGANTFHVNEYTLKLDGFSLLTPKEKVIKTEDFRLPPAQKTFRSGPYECTIGKLKKESRITSTSFKCTYQGENYGMVNPLSIMAKLEDGQEFPNVTSSGGGMFSGVGVIKPGGKTKVPVEFRISTKIIDMQFATFYIVWNETFTESTPVEVPGSTVNLVLDPGMTEAQNR